MVRHKAKEQRVIEDNGGDCAANGQTAPMGSGPPTGHHPIGGVIIWYSQDAYRGGKLPPYFA